MKLRVVVAASALCACAALSGASFAQTHPPAVAHAVDVEGAPDHGDHPTGAPGLGDPAKGAAAAGAHDKGAHAEGDHHDPNGPPDEINFWRGLLGTTDEPSDSFVGQLLLRPKNLPPPFLANLINFAVFAWVVWRFGRKPLAESLRKRKDYILHDMDAAQKMKADAENRLASYEERLSKIDQEIERIRRDFREQGERDKARIVKEAAEKRELMLKDAAFMIEQEAKQLRVTLLQETVDGAVRAAEESLRKRIGADDDQRLGETFLLQLAYLPNSAKGGQA